VAARASGADFLVVLGFLDATLSARMLESIRKAVGSDLMIEYARPHGTGLMNVSGSDEINEEDVVTLVHAGADVIGIAAPGTYPGWDIRRCAAIASAVHGAGGLCSMGVHTSQEGSTATVLEQVALYAKMAGADIHELGDCGYAEQSVIPENIMSYGLAIRGRRHHYRRMALSLLR
jgi:hypothetical protein